MDLEKAREILMKHSRVPTNGLFPPIFTHEYKITNPLCGDQVELKINLSQDTINEIGFLAKACAICSASTSMMCEEVKGKNLEHAQKLSLDFEESVIAQQENPWPQGLENLKSFEHLRVNPTRKACALLPWIALRSLLKQV